MDPPRSAHERELSQPPDPLLRGHRHPADGLHGVRPVPAAVGQRAGEGRRPDRRAAGDGAQPLRRGPGARGAPGRPLRHRPALARALRAGDDGRRASAGRRRWCRSSGSRASGSCATGVGAIADAGSAAATAVAERELVDPGGRRYRLELSDRTAPAYARSVRRITGLNVVVRSGDQTIGATLRGVPRGAAAAARRRGRRRRRRVSRRVVRGPRGLRRRARRASRCSRARRRPTRRSARRGCSPAPCSAGFFILAFTFAAVVSKSLQSRIGAFLDAARRLGRGDFSAAGADRGQRRVRRARAWSSTRWPASSRPGWRSSASSARAWRTSCAASARRSRRTSTATRCSRSPCAPPSTASRPTAGGRRCAATRSRRPRSARSPATRPG